MITTMKIMEAIQVLAAKEIPQIKEIYLDLAPVQFARPSLLIQSVLSSNDSANKGLVETTEYFTLTVFDETDDYERSDTRRLLDLRNAVLQLFRPGYLQVEDRALGVQASSGGRNWDKAYVEVELRFFDERKETTEDLPLVETIETKTKVKGEA